MHPVPNGQSRTFFSPKQARAWIYQVYTLRQNTSQYLVPHHLSLESCPNHKEQCLLVLDPMQSTDHVLMQWM